MLDKLVAEYRLPLVLGVGDAIESGIVWAQSKAKGQLLHEPDVIAGLVLRSLEDLAHRWQPIFAKRGLRFRATGVFCHQSPYVHFKNSTCEVGDLLVAHFHSIEGHALWQTALLLQAKIGPAGVDDSYRLSNPKDLIQLQLYTDWPDFRFTTGNIPDPSRVVTPRSRHPGAQYLLIGENARSGSPPYQLSVRPAAVELVHGFTLATALVNLLRGSIGRGFDDEKAAQSERGWSRVVWDLLNLSGVFNRARISVEMAARGRSYSDYGVMDDRDATSPSVVMLETSSTHDQTG